MKKEKQIVSIGDVAWDIMLCPKKELVWGSDVPGMAEFMPGGSAANFAVWASRLGAGVKLIGKIGDDFIGRLMKAHLKKEGVKPDLAVISHARTARIGVMIAPGGERAFVMDKGVEMAFHPQDGLPRISKRCDLFFFTGYSIFTPGSLSYVKKVLEKVRKLSIPIAFDPASFHLMEAYGPKKILDELGHVRFLLLNEQELESLIGSQNAEILLENADMVVVKQGAAGSSVYLPGQKKSYPAFPTDVVDTTGAGDAFDAAFLIEYLNSRNVENALIEGNKLGSLVVRQIGAQTRSNKE